MNIDEMTDDKKRIRIAEACGWTDIKKRGCIFTGSHASAPGWRSAVPDYLKSLEAMFHAESTLTPAQVPEYEDILWLTVKHEWAEMNDKTAIFAPWHATAAQRSRAFLRLLSEI